MNKRSVAFFGLAALALVGVMALVGAGAAALRPSDRARANAQIQLPIASLQEGVPLTIRVNYMPLILLRPSQAQLDALARLDEHVWDSSRSAWNEEIGAFVYWAWDTRFGCELRHVPPGESILVKYSEDKEDVEWLGGYVSRCEMAYDFAGRTIRTWQFSYNGFNPELPNLESPSVNRSGSRFFVSFIER